MNQKHIENKIKLLLVVNGYDRERIQFKGRPGKRYLRYRYWEPISEETFGKINDGIREEVNGKLYGAHLIPIVWDDEDTGANVAYDIVIFRPSLKGSGYCRKCGQYASYAKNKKAELYK